MHFALVVYRSLIRAGRERERASWEWLLDAMARKSYAEMTSENELVGLLVWGRGGHSKQMTQGHQSVEIYIWECMQILCPEENKIYIWECIYVQKEKERCGFKICEKVVKSIYNDAWNRSKNFCETQKQFSLLAAEWNIRWHMAYEWTRRTQNDPYLKQLLKYTTFWFKVFVDMRDNLWATIRSLKK